MNLEKLSRDGKIMMLAYDQGFEHGPTDFNEQNLHPEYIYKIAQENDFTCVASQLGIAKKFWQNKFEDVPLVAKLNGRTNLGKKAFSAVNHTVAEALEVGASAVGYTIYVGGEYEAEMIRDFSKIRREAHAAGIAVFAWMYPWITMPSSSDDERQAHIVAYAARVGAELGADVIKIKMPHEQEALPWIVKNAVGTKVLLSGGDPRDEDHFLGELQQFINAGGNGIAVGRNVWTHPHPNEISAKISHIIFG